MVANKQAKGLTKKDVAQRRDCKHIVSVGERVSYVDLFCPKAFMVLGTFATSDSNCINCRSYKSENKKERSYKYG